MGTRLIRSILVTMCMLSVVQGWSQIENIPISEEITLDRLYAGLLANTRVAVTDLSQSNELTFQAGGRVKVWLVPQTLSVRSFGVVKVTGGETTQTFTNFEFILSPVEKVSIHIGVMATPTTELRPNPSTWQSQVETNAESTFPGGRPGVKAKYELSESIEISYGVHNQDNKPAHHVKLAFKELMISGFLRNGKFSAGAKWSSQKIEMVTSYRKELFAFSIVALAYRSYRLFADMAFNLETNKRLFSKWGIRKYYASRNLLSGFFSISYDHFFEHVEGGFFIHI